MRSKLLLAALAASTMLALAVGSASARNLSISETGVEALWTPLTFEAGGARIECNVTLLMTFHYRTMAKAANALVGNVNHAGLEACRGGGATILTETLPWHVQYVSFSGTLPRITAVRLALVGASFSVDPEGSLPLCLVGTTQAHPAFGNATLDASGRVTGLAADERVGIPLGGSFLCRIAGEGFFAGTATVGNLALTAAITITLI